MAGEVAAKAPGTEAPASRAGRAWLIVATIAFVLALPVALLAAAIAVPVLVMGLAGSGEADGTTVLLGLLGVAVTVSPVVILVGLVLMWVFEVRGRRRKARWAALVSLPFAILPVGFSVWALLFASFT